MTQPFLKFLPPHKSKHSAKPFEGKVKINYDSSLRKLMRATRRDMLTNEVQFRINMAQRSAWGV